MKNTQKHNHRPNFWQSVKETHAVCLLVLFLVLSINCFLLGRLVLETHRLYEKMPMNEITPMEKNLKELTAGHPIQAMVPFIAKEKKETIAFLVAIAKKESNWGKYTPKKNGRECFNYWGYRGTYNQTRSGYSCFDSPEQAVAVVSERINELTDQKIDTPREMVVWKCGRVCSTHNPYSVKKWITDVAYYFEKVEKL